MADSTLPIDGVWQLLGRPAQAGALGGPPTYSATFEKHDVTPGCEVTYFMTGLEGDRPRGSWRVTSVDPPTSRQFADGFVNDDGTPNEEMPIVNVEVRLSERDNGTRMQLRSTYESREEMNMLIEMGAVEAPEEGGRPDGRPTRGWHQPVVGDRKSD